MSFQLAFSLILCEIFQHDYFNLSDQTHYIIYAVTQYIVGFSQYGLDISTFILFIELTSAAYGSFVSIFNLTIFAVGELIILVVSYYFRDWHMQNLFIALYTFTIMFMILIILPESPRFLVSTKRYEEAADVLNRIGKYNGCIDEKNLINEEVIRNELKNEKENKKSIEDSSTEVTNEKNAQVQSSPVFYYLTHPFNNFFKTILLTYVWFSGSMCYYGMTFGITSISDDFDPYLMFLSCTIAEIIGMLGGFYGTQYSRRTLLMVYFLITAVTSFLVAIIPNDEKEAFSFRSILIMFCAFCGKVLISTIFYLIYHYSSKVYPTRVRNTLVSFACCLGRFGAILAPQIILLRMLVWAPLPYFIFAFSSFLALGSVFLLPCERKLDYDI